MIEGEEIFMRRALELASLGLGTTSPNPQVGAVLVHEGKIITDTAVRDTQRYWQWRA